MRFIITFCFGLMPQDAYYFSYSQHLDLSYYDHPPMIAYLLGAFTSVFGKSVLIIKLTNFITTTFSLIFFYQLCRKFYPNNEAQIIMLLLGSTLLISILSLISTPDVPLFLFWCLSILNLYKALFESQKSAWVYAGICMGLALDSKYTAIALPVGMLLYLFLATKHRKYLLSVWPWLSICISLIIFSPVIFWNYTHHFESFRFQSTNRISSMGGTHFEFKYLLGLIGHQSAIVFPTIFGGLIYYLSHIFRKYRFNLKSYSEQNLFLLCFLLPLFLGFTFISLFYWVKINWIMPAYITGFIWLFQFLNSSWIKVHFIFAIIIHLAFAVEILFYPVPIKSDDTWYGWEKLALGIDSLKTSHRDAFIFSADDYKTTAILNFYLEEKVYSGNIIGKNALQFGIWDKDISHLQSKDALFIDSDPLLKGSEKIAQPIELSGYFDSIQVLQPIKIYHKDQLVRQFQVYLCKNYKNK